MPELPEVQSVIDCLKQDNILNKKIINVSTTQNKLFKNCDFNTFKNHVLNETVKDISRIGKYIIFHLTNNKIFVNHLRMEGKLFFENKKLDFDKKHTLVFFDFENDFQLRYNDTRRFGTFTIYFENNYLDSKELKKIALDPLDVNFDWKYLKNNLYKSSKSIKTILLDQTKVSGIGNIYADEILFASKINPLTKSSDLNDSDFQKIAKNATLILKKAVENKGTTISTYFFKKEQKGEFQKYLQVHTKKGFKCNECRNLIIKIKVNNRGTYICPKCQKI